MKDDNANEIRRLIFHIDVNSAFLSWESAYRLQHGEKIDLRKIPSAVGGDEKSRHGIVLAKSMPAKKFGIKTGESLYSAYKKCPTLEVVPPSFGVYVKCSDAMVDLLKGYSLKLQRFSIDECFIDITEYCTNTGKSPKQVAFSIKEKIKEELGFTVNIGISTNKLLAKMASDFEKPDKVHTLYKEEIKEKMWKLEVEKLFMVGRATAPKLHRLNIFTIGDLANYDIDILKYKFKSMGTILHNYANGIEDSEVMVSDRSSAKGVGNSTTTSFDIKDYDTAHLVILSLVETTAMRLRKSHEFCSVITVQIKTSEFQCYSKQRKLSFFTDNTKKISEVCCELFKEAWKGEPVRMLGVNLSGFCDKKFTQVSLFDNKEIEKSSALDKTIDKIRLKFGSKAVIRSSFLHSGINPFSGKNEDDKYPILRGKL